MATNYLATRTGTAGTGAGGKHAAYISGLDRHADKTEVQAVMDKNIPASVARDGLEFFQKADELERANGRSYRSLIIAIPREATDKTAWAQTYVDDLLKDRHAYRLAIHDKGDGNPHAHLMFSERGLKEGQTAKDFFSRKNPKPTYATSKKESADWLKQAKALYLTHVQKVAPDFVPTPKGEPKIGPKLKNASAAFEAKRADREKTVHGIRDGEKSLQILDAKILDGKTAYAIDQHRPAFERLTPNQHPKARATIRLHISKPNKDGSPKTMKQILDDVGRAIAQWLKAQTVELERMAQEAQARAMEAERQRLAAHGGIPSPFDFRPSSKWGRAEEAQTVTAPADPTSRHKP